MSRLTELEANEVATKEAFQLATKKLRIAKEAAERLAAEHTRAQHEVVEELNRLVNKGEATDEEV